MSVAVVMLGARMHYAVPRVLAQAGLLDRLFTDAYIGNKPVLQGLLRTIPRSLLPLTLRRLLGRQDSRIPAEIVTSFDAFGLRYSISLARAVGPQDRARVFVNAACAFNQKVIAVGLGGAKVVFGYNTASREVFSHAKLLGKICVLDQTSLPKRLESELTSEERMRRRGWEPGQSFVDERDLADREFSEWSMANLILAPSEFVAAGLKQCGVPEERIQTVPYGVDLTYFRNPGVRGVGDSSRPLRVLFVGRVSVMKGIPDLLDAIEQIPPDLVEIRLAGAGYIYSEKLQRCPPHVRLLGHVPRSDVRALYEWADILVVPSISEGSATVAYEALASGAPVIATENAGTPVKQDVTGFIVPIHNPDAIADSIRAYASNRSLLRKHSQAAIDQRNNLGLERYGTEVSTLLKTMVG